MHLYTTGQWVLLFFFYCFCGWVWECCYVSLRQRRWVNRGFLHGPVLPIYGSGAIIILFVTLPVELNASSRGLEMLESGGYISYDQRGDAKAVLRAAAMTYIVAALSTLVSFLRLLMIANNSRRRN